MAASKSSADDWLNVPESFYQFLAGNTGRRDAPMRDVAPILLALCLAELEASGWSHFPPQLLAEVSTLGELYEYVRVKAPR